MRYILAIQNSTRIYSYVLDYAIWLMIINLSQYTNVCMYVLILKLLTPNSLPTK